MEKPIDRNSLTDLINVSEDCISEAKALENKFSILSLIKYDNDTNQEFDTDYLIDMCQAISTKAIALKERLIIHKLKSM